MGVQMSLGCGPEAPDGPWPLEEHPSTAAFAGPPMTAFPLPALGEPALRQATPLVGAPLEPAPHPPEALGEVLIPAPPSHTRKARVADPTDTAAASGVDAVDAAVVELIGSSAEHVPSRHRARRLVMLASDTAALMLS